MGFKEVSEGFRSVPGFWRGLRCFKRYYGRTRGNQERSSRVSWAIQRVSVGFNGVSLEFSVLQKIIKRFKRYMRWTWGFQECFRNFLRNVRDVSGKIKWVPNSFRGIEEVSGATSLNLLITSWNPQTCFRIPKGRPPYWHFHWIIALKGLYIYLYISVGPIRCYVATFVS